VKKFGWKTYTVALLLAIGVFVLGRATVSTTETVATVPAQSVAVPVAPSSAVPALVPAAAPNTGKKLLPEGCPAGYDYYPEIRRCIQAMTAVEAKALFPPEPQDKAVGYTERIFVCTNSASGIRRVVSSGTDCEVGEIYQIATRTRRK